MSKTPRIDLLIGDFNAHNKGWSIKSNRMGTVIKNYTEANSYKILNDKKIYTHCNSKNGTMGSPDLAMFSKEKMIECTWEVGEDMSSDHLPMIVTIKMKNKHICRHRNKHWIYEKCDKNTFLTKFISEIRHSKNKMNGINIDKINEHIAKILLKVSEETCPRNTVKEQRQGVRYWNMDCKKAVELKKRLRRQMQRRKTMLSRLFYKQQCKKTKKVIENAKKNFLTNLLNKNKNNTLDI